MFEGYSEKGQGSEERGPGTFTFQPPGVVQARAAEGQAVPVQGGIRGQAVVGNTAQSINLETDRADRTVQALLKFGGELIAPQIKAAKEEQFITGMQRAASGEALTEIINEQPWFTKIFGDGPLVEGARAYEVEAKATQWATAHEQNMSALRTQDPTQIPKYLMETMKQHLTGDAATDTLIKGNMIKMSAGLIKRQTKENYIFLQEQISEQRTNAMLSKADYLAAMHKAPVGVHSPEARDVAAQELLAISTPTDGADPKAFWTDFKGVLGVLAEKGNFHAINAYEKAGVFANIPVAERLGLERQRNQFQTYHAAQASDQYAVRIAKIKTAAHGVGPNGMPLISADDVIKQYNAINDEHTKETGNPALIIPKSEQVSTMVTAAQAVAHYQQAAQKQIYKETDKLTKSSLALQQIKQYNYAGALESSDDKAATHELFYESYKANPDVKLLVYNAAQADGQKGVNPQVQRDLAGLAQSGNIGTYSPNFEAAYQRWKEIYRTPGGGAAAAAKYFTDEHHKRLMAFDRNLGDKDIKIFGDPAFQDSLRVRASPGHTWTAPQKVEVSAHIKKQYPNLDPEGQRVMMEAAAREMGSIEHNSLQPIADSLHSAVANGVEAGGKYAWLTEGRSANVVPYQTYLQRYDGAPLMDRDTMDYTFNQTLANLRAQIIPKTEDVKATKIWRQEDRAGEAVFRVLVTDSNDRVYPLIFTTANIRAEHSRNEERKAKPIPGPSLPSQRIDNGSFGPTPKGQLSGLSKVLISQ